MSGPLSGIRVLDLTNVLAGPFCCHQLAHMGAEVIKIEVPGRGDLARNLGADADLNSAGMGVSFLAQNAGKRSVTLNLKDPRGADLFLQLVAGADVVVENFRPGVMDRLGLGPERLRGVRPDLVYCAISGFGQDGPWAGRPAYDQIVQGASGAMAITGDAETAPLRAGFPIADTVGGLTAAFAIAAALNARPRGTVIDVSMLDSLLATMGWAVSNWLIAGQAPVPNGNENPTSAPSGTFRTATGPINIAANKEEQWQILIRHLDLPALAEDPRFRSREDRKAHRTELREALETVLTTRPAADWEAELNPLGVPAGAVLSVEDALASDQIAAREAVATYDGVPSVDRPVKTMRTGFRLDGAPASVATPPPGLGQDTDAVLSALGIGPDEIAKLRTEGVI